MVSEPNNVKAEFSRVNNGLTKRLYSNNAKIYYRIKLLFKDIVKMAVNVLLKKAVIYKQISGKVWDFSFGKKGDNWVTTSFCSIRLF